MKKKERITKLNYKVWKIAFFLWICYFFNGILLISAQGKLL